MSPIPVSPSELTSLTTAVFVASNSKEPENMSTVGSSEVLPSVSSPSSLISDIVPNSEEAVTDTVFEVPPPSMEA